MNAKQKREALAILLTWHPAVIRHSLENPTPYMGTVTLALHRIALRRMEA